MISLADFTSALLAPWFVSPPDAERGELAATPREAARAAAYEATMVRARQRGTVLIRAQDPSHARDCLDYLKAFFTDSPRLAELLRRHVPDGVELRGCPRIMVTSEAQRRPPNVLSTIVVARHEPAVVSEIHEARTVHMLWYELMRRDPAAAARLAAGLGIEGAEAWCTTRWQDTYERARERHGRFSAPYEITLRADPAPAPNHSPPSPRDPTSAEFTRAAMEARELKSCREMPPGLRRSLTGPLIGR